MKKVWIDAGHGGKDSGAAANGLLEKNIALALSLGVKTRLEAGYEDVQVQLSRSTDVFVELADRTNAANRAGADVLVSIHCNAGGGSGGFESYRYSTAQPASSALQNVLHAEIMAALKPFGVTDRGKKAKNLHMVRESRMPAVLTENLFIDVAADANLLKQSKVIDALADGHASGIAKHLGLKRKDSGEPGNDPVRDIDKVSPWAAAAWENAVKNGFFDGKRPGASITREEAAVLVSRLQDHFSKLMATKLEKTTGATDKAE
ncbi:N-acetylmuramoyl-L-alanine amidase [Paenibacillus sp. DMB20]|uniref:N-acetylmuramoyl-L-alanine amidase n=1 Tax=Paenibacillus sp. DMB20 TaxID=1642570 RepID=UPI0009E1ED90|nr:N-acetylmuramoyl-L-alanine amidase [Paenibacillus sp. DMB20]